MQWNRLANRLDTYLLPCYPLTRGAFVCPTISTWSDDVTNLRHTRAVQLPATALESR